MKKSIFAIALLLIIACLVGYFYYPSQHKLTTYFTYSNEELESLSKMSSDATITKEELTEWDSVMFDEIKAHKLGDAPVSRVLAYMYVAQYDFAALSYNLHQQFLGNISAISSKVMCLLFPEECAEFDPKNLPDAYSNKLAEIVIQKIKARMEADTAQTKNYPAKIGKDYWAGVKPYFGQEVGSWIPWAMTSSHQFRAQVPPVPGSPAWQAQLQMTKSALAQITPEQKMAVIFWAGNPGTLTPPGQWSVKGTDYMISHDVNLKEILLVRAVLSIAIADAVIGVFDSKYTYWIKRPNMLDPSINTIMPTPNHPSYPAGHATISAAAATVLIHYFPENTPEWNKDKYEATHSRIWGGIHFTVDSDVGNLLGDKIGKTAISRIP